MSDEEIFFEAITAFKGSQTYRGQMELAGEPAIVTRYRHLGPRVVNKLSDLLNDEEISFANLPTSPTATLTGDSANHRFGSNIRVNQIYASKPEVVSAILVHEGCHLAFGTERSTMQTEYICRVLQTLYYKELLGPGLRFDSPSRGPTTYRMETSDDAADLKDMLKYFQRGQLIDYILHFSGEREKLEAGWVQRSLSWWRGISNRWFATRGHYARVLAEEGTRWDQSILEILKSMPLGNRDNWEKFWHAARSDGGSVELIRASLNSLQQSPLHAQHIQAIKEDWDVN